MRYLAASVFVLLGTTVFHAQGPCTEAGVQDGKTQTAQNAFSYMPPYGKPVTGKAEIQSTAEKKFAGRTNIKRSWESDHHIAASESGDMAYEHGTMDISYDQNGESHTFKAVMLNVYKANGSACEMVAGTMQPLDEGKH